MRIEQYLKNLKSPSGKVDIILDTDAYTEVDDLFALAYLLRSQDQLNIKGICAAPFYHPAEPFYKTKSTSPEDGMEKSYYEILKILHIADREDLNDRVFRGSPQFMENNETPVVSEAARFIANTAKQYSSEKPLYVVSIGAITNVASALLLNPEMKETSVIIWLGGHALHWKHNQEYNLCQDIIASRIIFGCGAPLVQLPCEGVVDRFSTSRYEMEHWLSGKNPLCDHLLERTIVEAEEYYADAKNLPWTWVIFDVTAVAWLLNDNHRFMDDQLIHSPIPQYDHHYSIDNSRHLICYVTNIYRDALFADLFKKLAG